jgi:hypothetical protein
MTATTNSSLWERTGQYEIISEKISEGIKTVTLRTSLGAIVKCNIPVKTPEETEKLRGDICTACTHFMRPDWDLSKISYMEVSL